MRSYADPTKALRGLRKSLRQIERALDRGLRTGDGPGCCGVGLAQCHALLAIPEDGGELSQLSRELGVEASTLTRTLDGLAGARLVNRHSNEQDRRKGRVLLSPEGRLKVEEIDGAWNAWLAAVLEKVPEGKRDLVLEGVGLLAEALGEDLRTEGPRCC